MTVNGGPRTLVGVLTPSSNTRLEPLTAAMLAGVPDVTAHFSRLRVVEVSLADSATGQFDVGPMLAAADLLGDARVDVVTWSGTSGAWKGLDADREVCAAITTRLGVPATTGTLALLAALEAAAVKRIALVTPYPADMQAAIVRVLEGQGLTVTGSATEPIDTSNWDLSTVDEPTLSRLVAEAAATKPDAIVPFCTNLAAAQLVPQWEAEHGLPVYDSTALSLWHALVLAGVDPAQVTGWGSLFAVPRP